ncbi:MAG: M4 family metallopeptidase [Rhodoferax sp.]|nr:M4 family metallopeptidase [Actinomycetota bacterium]
MKRTVLVSAALLGSLALAAPWSAAAAPAADGGRDAAVARATGLARGHGTAFGLDAEQGLSARDVVIDASGAQHVRFDRTWRGLPVVAGDLVVHSTSSGAWAGASAAALRVVPVSGEGTVSAAGARSALVARYPADAVVSTAQRVVDARAGAGRLAWRATVSGVGADQTPYDDVLVVDAVTGAVSLVTKGVKEGQGTGVYVGSVAFTTTPASGGTTLTDNGRGGQRTIDMLNRQGGKGQSFVDADDSWGTGSASNRQSAAADAHYGAERTWDFYFNTYGRNGIKNDGVGALSRVHYGSSYNNAFWSDSCFCMTYGDGVSNARPLTELDVAGHEMSHGVTSATANLNYSGDAGGLNEATSDISGTMVEFTANNAADVGDYQIGELININGNGTPLRYMDRPSRDTRSVDCWSTSVAALDPHYSSGVGNHLFYLLAEGSGAKTLNGVTYNSPTCNSTTTSGIGRDAASFIWYRALTVYMTSTTTYPQARAATLQAATDKYGVSSPQYAATAAAWSAVGVS